MSQNSFNIDKSKVSGTISHTTVSHKPASEQAAVAARGALALALYWMVAALIAGIVLVLAAPRMVESVTHTMRMRPGASIGWGLIVVLLTPIILVILALTVVGIPLALLIGGLWLLLIGFSQLLAGIAVGDFVMRRAEWKKDSLLWAAVAGIPVTVIFFSIPWLGAFLALIATFWAVGGTSLASRALR
jgi:hypothetical protein